MATRRPKAEVITFKADAALLEALAGVPNRSELIRAAILSALDSQCPLCSGTGLLSPNQKCHWESFAAAHPLRECRKCNEVHLVCARDARARSVHP